MKRRIFFIFLIAILIGGVIYLNQLMIVITGYAAKNLASGIFVSGRSQKEMEKNDLNFSFIRYTKNIVDYNKKEVVSRFLWNKSKAIYIKGFGCVLIRDYSEEEIRNRSYKIVPSLPEEPDTISWPMGDKIVDTIPKGIDTIKLRHVMNKIMSDTIPFKGTYGCIVVYKSQIISEKYKKGFNLKTKFLGWSMGKSFVNSLIGLRSEKGKININSPLNLKEWVNDDRKNITINNLMHMNSGLKWNENYGALSDVTIMLYKKGNMGLYTAQKALKNKPDSIWNYSSGSTNLVCKILRSSFDNDSLYYSYPRKEFFNKIGMKSAVIEVDASGTFVGSSYVYASLRDYARYGLLYLNRGMFMGRKILSSSWIDYTLLPANGSEGKYGAYFWLNLSGYKPDIPHDSYRCDGHDGQYIFIVPSYNLIVVRTGFSKHGEFDNNLMMKEILECLKTKKY